MSRDPGYFEEPRYKSEAPIEIKRGKNATITITNLSQAAEIIKSLIDERENLLAKYEERGAAMRSTGDMVRSIYTPQVEALKGIIRELWLGNFEKAKELDDKFKKEFSWTTQVRPLGG